MSLQKSKPVQVSSAFIPKPSSTPVEIKQEQIPDSGPDQFEHGLKLFNLGLYSQAETYFEKAASHKYPPAYIYLGMLYKEHRIKKLDAKNSSALSTEYFTLAKLKHNEEWLISESKKDGKNKGQLIYCLGLYHQYAKNDFQETYKGYYFEAATKYGIGEAKCSYAAYLESCQKDASPLDWILKNQRETDVAVHYKLGLYYENNSKNNSNPEDISNAMYWYKEAAKAGHATAKLKLAKLLLSHKDSPAAANYLLQEVAAQDVPEAIKEYASFLKTYPDKATPQFFYTECQRNNNINLYYIFVDCLEPATRIQFLKFAAQNGDATLQYEFGLYCLSQKQNAQASNWFTKAAAQNHGGAIEGLKKLQKENSVKIGFFDSTPARSYNKTSDYLEYFKQIFPSSS